MNPYAQTNIQLFNQLRREGYSNEDLLCVFKAYELAMQLFTCFFRPSGKTFIAHLVGTASILGSLRVSAEVAAAGLIHAVYDEGDFGSIKRGISNAKREQVRRAVGEKVEEYVARYAALRWNPKTISAVRDGLDTLDLIDRNVLLIRLTNELEDHFDLGVLYCPNADVRKQSAKRRGLVIVDMADKLGFPTLAVELDRVFREIVSGKIPLELHSTRDQNRAYLVPPRSYQKRLSAAFYQEAVPGLDRLRSTIDVRKRFRRLVRGLRGYINR